VQLPLAKRSIMLGINQVVMMVLSVAIIAGLIGAGGLGLEVVFGLTHSEIGRGLEAGASIFLLAVVIDRITQAAGEARRARGRSARPSFGIAWPTARLAPASQSAEGRKEEE
jgi:ABC-type proline/glycine betaine transport system permease subunit